MIPCGSADCNHRSANMVEWIVHNWQVHAIPYPKKPPSRCLVTCVVPDCKLISEKRNMRKFSLTLVTALPFPPPPSQAPCLPQQPCQGCDHSWLS